MKETVEYAIVFSAALVLIVFMFLQGYTGAFIAADTIEQDRLKQEAEALLEMLLTSNGDPPNWGETVLTWENNKVVDFYRITPERLGLADQNALRLYVLSPSKINMLANEWLSYEQIIDALAIRKHLKLVIKPVINIEITYLDSTD